MTMLTLEAKNQLTKIPISDIRISLLSCWLGMSKRLPKHTVTHFFFCFGYFPDVGYVLIAEDVMHFKDKVQKLLS